MKRLVHEWDNILMLKNSSPYVFRTRLERTLNHTVRYADSENDEQLLGACKLMAHKLQYISDQSNQTADGCLNSFIVLEQDMLDIKDKLNVQFM